MCKDSKYFKILHHGNLIQILPQVYSIKGTMKLFGLFQYSRNMTILHSNGSVILVNPVRVNEVVEKEILALGSIDHILKIGSLHSVDIPYYKDKFNPKLWAMPKDRSLPDYKSDEILTHGMKLPFLGIELSANNVQLWISPKAMLDAVVMPVTATGVVLSVVVLSPNCPKVLSPQHLVELSANTAQLWAPPKAMV